jgi:hypothetical protein
MFATSLFLDVVHVNKIWNVFDLHIDSKLIYLCSRLEIWFVFRSV